MFHLIVFATVAAGATTGAAAGASPASAAPTGSAASGTGTGTVVQFRTDVQPRVDPVFGDARALRADVDRFVALEGEMQRARDELSVAVHETLAALAHAPSSAGNTGSTGSARVCPAQSGPPYARALAAGARYLALGQQLQTRYRDIRRADELGDAVALTPDYRARVKQAKDLFQQRLTEYREMRVAFYDQLGAELRHAACKPSALEAMAAQAPVMTDPAVAEAQAGASADADAVTMTNTSKPAEASPAPAKVAASASAASAAGAGSAATGANAASAPAISIDIDNSLCAQPTRVSIDGQQLGLVEAGRRASLRTRAGPRAVCALPASDARTCGDAGTIRRAYLHEGWSLAIRCSER